MLGHPMTWVEHPIYLILTAVAVIITTFASKRIYKLKTFLILDAVGLVVFTILGIVTGFAGGIMHYEWSLPKFS